MEDVEDELAEELKNKCPVGVFDIEDIGKGKSVSSTSDCYILLLGIIMARDYYVKLHALCFARMCYC